MNSRIFLTAVICGALLAICGSIVAAQPVPPEQEDVDVTVRKAVRNESMYAGINERYWTVLADDAWRWDTGSKIATTLLGLFALVFPIIFEPSQKRKIARRSIQLFGVIAFGISLVALLMSSADYNEISLIQRRWQSLRTEWDTLSLDRKVLPPDILRARYDALIQQKKEIENSEPSEKDTDVMHQAWLQEMHFRNVDPNWIAQVKKNRAENAN